MVEAIEDVERDDDVAGQEAKSISSPTAALSDMERGSRSVKTSHARRRS